MTKRKTRAESLIELLNNPKGRAMIEKTHTLGGHIIDGSKKCTI